MSVNQWVANSVDGFGGGGIAQALFCMLGKCMDELALFAHSNTVYALEYALLAWTGFSSSAIWSTILPVFYEAITRK